MSTLRQLILLRHGESVGNSGERLIGSGDPELAPSGRAQIGAVRSQLRGDVIDLVVASPLQRSWQSAGLLASGTPVRLERDFRERHFGRWEGRTLAEIEAVDPVAFRDWQAGAEGFEFPGGELRAEFVARVRRGLERLRALRIRSALLVLHKGVIRVLVEELVGTPLARGKPQLGELTHVTRYPDGTWRLGRRSTNPPGLDRAA